MLRDSAPLASGAILLCLPTHDTGPTSVFEAGLSCFKTLPTVRRLNLNLFLMSFWQHHENKWPQLVHMHGFESKNLGLQNKLLSRPDVEGALATEPVKLTVGICKVSLRAQTVAADITKAARQTEATRTRGLSVKLLLLKYGKQETCPFPITNTI